MERLLFPFGAALQKANRLQRYEKSRHRKDVDSKMKLLSITLLAWQKYEFLQKSYKFATFNGIFSASAAFSTSLITFSCASQMAE